MASKASSLGGMLAGCSKLVLDDFDGFQAVAGDADADGFIAGDAAGFDEFNGGGQRCAAGGFGPDPFGAGEEFLMASTISGSVADSPQPLDCLTAWTT